MSEPKVAKVFDYIEYDLTKARDGNTSEEIIWNRIYILKIEGEVYFRKEQHEKWMDLRLFRAIDISPAHHSYFYLKHSALAGKKLIVAVGRTFYAEPSLTGSVLLMNSSYIVIDPATDTELQKKVNKATTPALYNVTCTLADTEYSQALPANTKKFLVKARGGTLKLCFTSGQSGTTYLSIVDGGAYYEDNIEPSSLTLYFRSGVAGMVAEIVAWS